MKMEKFLRKCNKNNMFIKEKIVQSSYNLFLAELSRAKRPQRSSIGKKMW